MIKLRNWLAPEWARPGHPLLQYELTGFRQPGAWRGFLIQLLVLSALLGGGGALYAAFNIGSASAANLTGLIWRSLYYPALALQLLTMIIALVLGAAAVGAERSHKTWDNLRATEFGAGLALRARWAGILYRLRAPLILILAARFIFIAGMLYDLTAFGGYYPEMLGALATPSLPDGRLDLLLIALTATVALLLPPASIATAAAFGILLSVAIKERIYALVIQMLVISAPLLFAAAGALAITQTFQSGVSAASDWHFALFFAYAGFGDWGLLLAQLGSLGEIWGRLPFGWALSLALILLLLALGLAADGMMWLAARLSESRG